MKRRNKSEPAGVSNAPPGLPQPGTGPVLIAPGVGIDPAMLTDMVRAVVLEFAEKLPEQLSPEELEDARRRRGRQYAVRLRARMTRFRAVYNAAWFVRHCEAASKAHREQRMREFWQVCMKELESCQDIEAFTYAVSDALTCYRYGYPWEG